MISKRLEGIFLKIEDYILSPSGIFPTKITKEECLAISKFLNENKDHPRTTLAYKNQDDTAHCTVGLMAYKVGAKLSFNELVRAVRNVTKQEYRRNTLEFIMVLNDVFNLSFLEQSLYWEWKSTRLNKKAAAEK